MVIGYLNNGVLTPTVRLDADLDGVPDIDLPIDTAHYAVLNGQVITYSVTCANRGSEAANDVTVNASAYGALHFGGRDTTVVNLGTVGSGVTKTVGFYGTVDSGRDPDSAEMDAVVSDETHQEFDWFWVLHWLDSDGPENVEIIAPVDYARPGVNLVRGTAVDASGIAAITLKAVAQPGGAETTTIHPSFSPETTQWTCLWNPGDLTSIDSLDLYAKAIDTSGNQSDWSDPVTLSVDLTPPTVTLDSAADDALSAGLLNPLDLLLSGQVLDNLQALSLEATFSRATQEFIVPLMAMPGTDPTGDWQYPWRMQGGDGITETMTLLGIDAAGNTSNPLVRDYLIDTVSPVVTVTEVISQVLLADYVESGSGKSVASVTSRRAVGKSMLVEMASGGSGGPVLEGTVSDGGGVSKVYARLVTPTGEVSWHELELDGNRWQFTPTLSMFGRHLVTIEVYDLAGNAAGTETYELNVVGPAPDVQAVPTWRRGCAGWRYTIAITCTNDSELPMVQARVVVTPPGQTMIMYGESSPGLLEQPGSDSAIWELGDLGIGQGVVRNLVLHLFTNIPNETFKTLLVGADAAWCQMEETPVTFEVRTDGICAGPTPTPSTIPTATQTPTATATSTTPTATPTGTATPGPGGSIAGLVWLDTNGDGVQDPGEGGLWGSACGALAAYGGEVVT